MTLVSVFHFRPPVLRFRSLSVLLLQSPAMIAAPLSRVRLSQSAQPALASRSGLRGAAGASRATRPSPGIAADSTAGDEGSLAESVSAAATPESPLLPELLLNIIFSQEDFLGSGIIFFLAPVSLMKRSGGSESSRCGAGCCPTTLTDAIIPSPVCVCVFAVCVSACLTSCPECKLLSRSRQKRVVVTQEELVGLNAAGALPVKGTGARVNPLTGTGAGTSGGACGSYRESWKKPVLTVFLL